MRRIIFTLALILCFLSVRHIKAQYRLIDREKLTCDNVKWWLWYYDIKHPEIVLNQILLESGNLCSKLTKSNNNIMGLTYKGKRYLTFTHYKYCIKCYAKIQNRLRNNENYYAFLKRIGYAKDPNYIYKLKSM